jgi:hypothetical protein
MADPFTSLTRGFLQTVDPAAVGSALAGPKPSTILQLYGVKQRQKALAIRAKQFKLDGMTALTNAFKQENPKLVRSSLAFLTPIIGGDPKKLKPFFDMVADMEVSQRMLMIGALQSDPSLTLESIGPMLETKAGRLELSKRMQDEAAKMQTSQALGRVVNSITRGGNKLTVSNLTTRADAADAVGDSRLATAIRGRAVLVGKQAKEAQELKFGVSGEARKRQTSELELSRADEDTEQRAEQALAAQEATIAAKDKSKKSAAELKKIEAETRRASRPDKLNVLLDFQLIASGATNITEDDMQSPRGKKIFKLFPNAADRVAFATKAAASMARVDDPLAAFRRQALAGLPTRAAPQAAQNQTSSSFMKLFSSMFK